MDHMGGLLVIGRTVRRFSRLGCVAIKLNPGIILERGVKLKFEREASGVGGHGFHESTQTAVSIEINHEPQLKVTAEDGICAVKLSTISVDVLESNLPPCGCTVMAFQEADGMLRRERPQRSFGAGL